MAHNVEIKAYLEDPEALRERIEELADEGPTLLRQEDTFFHSRNGRLKLRRIDERAELIYYERSDAEEPTESQYLKMEVADAATTEAMLSVALDVRGTVSKRRQLYRVGQTRVHVDEVDGLGSFVELEVELAAAQPSFEGEAIARELMKKIGLDESDLVAGAYIDLLEAEPAEREE